ncbi:hypothetical protein ACJX0J_040308, partial [Zea mays]
MLSKSLRAKDNVITVIFINFGCNAKQETVEKVCQIMKNQLALLEDTNVIGETVCRHWSRLTRHGIPLCLF